MRQDLSYAYYSFVLNWKIMPEKHLLSKSTFMYGVQCKKRLYLHKNHKKFGVERDELSAQQEAVFSTGTNVGELAQQVAVLVWMLLDICLCKVEKALTLQLWVGQ